MIEYYNDVAEIIAQIESQCGTEETSRDYGFCVSQITQKIDDPYLMARADCIIEGLHSDKRLIQALKKLSASCNSKEKCCSHCPINKYCNHYILNAQQNYDKNAPKIVDLFCGAGGLSLGFSQEGFITVLANDIEPCCIDTYSHNHPETPRKHIVLGDIKDVIENIRELMRFDKIDVLVGGPPVPRVQYG